MSELELNLNRIEKRYSIFGFRFGFFNPKDLTVIEVSNVKLHLLFVSSSYSSIVLLLVVICCGRGVIVSGCSVTATMGLAGFRHLGKNNEIQKDNGWGDAIR